MFEKTTLFVKQTLLIKNGVYVYIWYSADISRIKYVEMIAVSSALCYFCTIREMTSSLWETFANIQSRVWRWASCGWSFLSLHYCYVAFNPLCLLDIVPITAQCWRSSVTEQLLSRCHAVWKALSQCWNNIGSGSSGGVDWLLWFVICHANAEVRLAVVRACRSEWAGGSEDGTRTNEMKWDESGFRPPLCTYRLNWARRTSWGWWDEWDDTVLQTQDSKFEPWRSEAEHATSRSRRLPTILTFTRGWGRNIFVSFKPPRPGTEPRTLAWKAAVLTATLGPRPRHSYKKQLRRRLWSKGTVWMKHCTECMLNTINLTAPWRTLLGWGIKKDYETATGCSGGSAKLWTFAMPD